MPETAEDRANASAERERQRRAIEAIAKTGVCYMNPATMAAYRRRAADHPTPAAPLFTGIRVILSPYLPDGIWSADLRYLPVEAVTEPVDELLLKALQYRVRLPGEPEG